MEPMIVILIFAALLTKHLVCDFPLQLPYQYRNKGTYGHFGGILHALIHVVGAFVALYTFVLFGIPLPISTIALLSLIDGVVHYHVDWAKVQVNTRYGLRPDNSEIYWWILGLDQWLHCMTYVIMVVILI